MASRTLKSTEYIRHDFSETERLKMGTELAESHNKLAAIDDEEAVVKAKFKERRATLEQSIGSLARDLGTGWTMINAECDLIYDIPNIGEVSYKRIDNGVVIKVRPMTQTERQTEISFDTPVVVNPEASAEESAENIAEFFEVAGEEVEESDGENEDGDENGEEYDVFSDPDPAAAKDATSSAHDAEFADVEQPRKRGRGRPPKTLRGFEGPTNATAMEEF